MNTTPSVAPCPSRRDSILEFVFGTLSSAATNDLAGHLKACSDCRRYFEELSALSDALRDTGEALPEAHASESFHGRVRALIQSEPACFPSSRWPQSSRVALASALAAAACVTLALLLFQPAPPKPVALAPTGAQPQSGSPEPSAPTWKSYQRAAKASLENLDAIIDRQAVSTFATPPAPVFYALSRRTETEQDY